MWHLCKCVLFAINHINNKSDYIYLRKKLTAEILGNILKYKRTDSQYWTFLKNVSHFKQHLTSWKIETKRGWRRARIFFALKWNEGDALRWKFYGTRHHKHRFQSLLYPAKRVKFIILRLRSNRNFFNHLSTHPTGDRASIEAELDEKSTNEMRCQQYTHVHKSKDLKTCSFLAFPVSQKEGTGEAIFWKKRMSYKGTFPGQKVLSSR